MLNVFFYSSTANWERYKSPLRAAFKKIGLKVTLRNDMPSEEVDYIILSNNNSLINFLPYKRLKAVLNLWAGVEHTAQNPTLQVPLTRMVDPAMTQGMIEWVTGHVLRHHLGMDAHINAVPGEWNQKAPPLAWQRKVAILGLGELGYPCAQTLAQIGFIVHGWSRSPKLINGIKSYHGEDGLVAALTGVDMVVLLLPATYETENTLNAMTLNALKTGAVVINPGRGHLIDDNALISALNCGQVSHATLDTFRTEPLPSEHPFWHHPKITVTPHIASESRPDSASQVIAQNIQRAETGQSLLHIVNQQLGY
ncbi:MAG: glyoxylate/hydroxypyruvate reductase A [Aestuariivita sp.]|nr:glyoxylate/hydroxypyruvate reductase A [Aestuariivita sp.]